MYKTRGSIIPSHLQFLLPWSTWAFFFCLWKSTEWLRAKSRLWLYRCILNKCHKFLKKSLRYFYSFALSIIQGSVTVLLWGKTFLIDGTSYKKGSTHNDLTKCVKSVCDKKNSALVWCYLRKLFEKQYWKWIIKLTKIFIYNIVNSFNIKDEWLQTCSL